MLQFQNGDTFQHQGDSAGIFMYSAGIFETFVKKILCQRASPMCSVGIHTSLRWGDISGKGHGGKLFPDDIEKLKMITSQTLSKFENKHYAK